MMYWWLQANLNDAFGMKERLIPFIDEQVIKILYHCSSG